MEKPPYYHIAVTFEDGTTAETIRAEQIDFFSEKKNYSWLRCSDREECRLVFTPKDAFINTNTQIISLDGRKAMIRFDDDDEKDNTPKKVIKSILFTSDNRLDKYRYLL